MEKEKDETNKDCYLAIGFRLLFFNVHPQFIVFSSLSGRTLFFFTMDYKTTITGLGDGGCAKEVKCHDFILVIDFFLMTPPPHTHTLFIVIYGPCYRYMFSHVIYTHFLS